jgi:predicted negative regulator of RcsB-dependent stress response
MAEHLSDEQRVEELKKWWDENGKAVIAGVVLGLGGLLTWKGWVYYQETQAKAASEYYARVRLATSENNAQTIVENTDILQGSYSSTPYAALAALELAKFKADAGDLEVAAERLRWAIDHGAQEAVRNTARIRLARVLVAQGKNDEVLDLLSRSDFLPVQYLSMVEEIRGDALLAKGEIDKARTAYTKALISAGEDSEYLRMKREDLGEAPESEAT